MVGGWKQVGHEGRTEVTTVDLVRADIGVGGCTNGHHTASSDGPFGVVVWGARGGETVVEGTAVVGPTPFTCSRWLTVRDTKC